MKILILEDNPVDADLCQRAIKGEITGCFIDIAATLLQARKLLNSGIQYDLALLDMNLPDGTGLELLTEIRESGANTGVIILTSTGNEEVATAALKAGADDYMPKKQGFTNQIPSLIKLTLSNLHRTRNNQANSIRVMYIEHNMLDVDLTQRHLKKFAPHLLMETVHSVEEAISMMEAEPAGLEFDVIMMDYRLPGMNALDFIKIIRQEKKLDIPIVIVTGQGDEEIAVQALKLGASDYINKNEKYLYRLPLIITNVYQQTELIRKQQKLTESETKYRLIAENAADVIFTMDTNFNCTYISPAIQALIGYDSGEIMNMENDKVLTPESDQRIWGALSETLPAGLQSMENAAAQRTVELEMVRKDGSKVWTEVKISLISEGNVQSLGILGVIRDITQRKAANDELRKLSRAVEQSPDSIIITNLDAEIEYCNPALCHLSGYTFEELRGKNPRIFGSGSINKSEIKKLWDTITQGEVWKGELCNKKKNGELYWEATTISPITDSFGNITHYLGIKKDITEQKKITQELIEAKIHAEESDLLKTAFLTNMSHEIRTPLNSIMGFASLLPDEDNMETMINYSNIIYKSSEQLVHIIDDIVLYSKLQTHLLTSKRTTFEINQLFSEIEDVFSLPEYHQAVKLEVIKDEQNSHVLYTDREKLKQVLVNLVSNAFKYTHEGMIRVGFSAEAQHCRFYVEDTGMGIHTDELEKVFDRFYRGRDALKSVIGGTGLGLSIVRELLHLLGGKIWAESEIGKGTTFYFTIQCKEY